VQEGAAARLQHRLWGIGISRRDAARLIRYSDHCSLLEGVISEEKRGVADSIGRLTRIERAAQPFVQSSKSGVFPDRNFKVSDAKAKMEAVREKYAPEAAGISEIDGLRLDMGDWWCSIRASNTEPLLRLNLEAATREMMEEKKNEIVSLITA